MQIIFPHGTYVSFILGNINANNVLWSTISAVSVVSSSKDVSSTTGLCGKLDGRPENDFHDRNDTTIQHDDNVAFGSAWK